MKSENNCEFLEVIKKLNQKEIGSLIDYAIKLKIEEMKQATSDYC